MPADIKRTFERLGIPEQERKFLAGVEAQFDSEAAYSNIKEAVSKQGVIFVNSSEALRLHPDIFRRWFGKVIPTGDNKFSALNSAVFSGGSFIYVPPGVKVGRNAKIGCWVEPSDYTGTFIPSGASVAATKVHRHRV